MSLFSGLILVLFLANRLEVTSSFESVNALQERSNFALQIEEIRATDAPPAEPDGNNLNGVPGKPVTSKNFQAISTIYLENEENINKKYDIAKRQIESDLSIYGTVTEVFLETKEIEVEVVTPIKDSLVWDSCLETLIQSYERNLGPKIQNNLDMEHQEFLSRETKTERKLPSESVKKRDASKITNSTAMQMWLDKYNTLKNGKTEERWQEKGDLVVTRKSIQTPTTTIKIIPITTEFIKESFEQVNVTFEFPVTDNNIKLSYTEDWFETKDRIRTTKIKFGGLPQRETYLVPALKLEEGFFPFGFMSKFFSLIHPFDFPIGLIKEIVWGKFTFPYSFLLSIKVESTFLVFIIIFSCIALIIPSYLIIVGILSLLSNGCNDEVEAGALFPELEESDCNDRVLEVVTLFVVMLCCALIFGMTLSNEQASLAAAESRDALRCACADVAAWLAAAARQLHHSLIPPVDLVLQAFKDDLRNVEPLLGDPIQKTISSESGIDMVLESLNDVVLESEDLSSKISSLRDISMQAGSLASAASDRLKDLTRQLDNLKKHCMGKDEKLCGTLSATALELKMKFDLILREQQLLELRSLGVENLTRAIGLAKQEFRTLPSAMSAQTTSVREDILRDMEIRRELIYRSSRILSDIVRYLTASLHSAARVIEPGLVRFQNYDVWRWIIMLGCSVLFGIVMTLILFAIMCGCGQAKGHAKRTLKVSSVWTCFVSILLWSMISGIFLIAGHAEVYVCHALWDAPQYNELSDLLDRPSPLFQDKEGMFDALFRDLENVTIEVSIKDVLRDCEKDQPAYNVFQLDKVLDVNKETSYFEWEELQADLGRLASSLDVGFLKSLSAELSRLLNEMLRVSDVELAKYRAEYNGPVVGRDLLSLADQLENVAAQVTDLTTSGRLEALASRTQRLHVTSIKPLEQFKADIVFKLTELELQLMPFRRKLNISLSHIHTAQFYINNQGEVIAHKKVSVYTNRLISHVAGWRTHVLSATATQAAKCKPLYAVYSAARALLCSRYVASLHGWWVCGLLLGLSWCGLTPLCVRLWRIYGRKIRVRDSMSLANLTSGQQETPTTALCESNNWNTPGPPPPPRNDSW